MFTHMSCSSVSEVDFHSTLRRGLGGVGRQKLKHKYMRSFADFGLPDTKKKTMKIMQARFEEGEDTYPQHSTVRDT